MATSGRLEAPAAAVGEHGPMASRAQVELTVTFGPTPSPLLPRAVSYATRHATTCAEIAPGVWRASFSLAADPEPYARAWRLLHLVGSWRATEVEVAGSPEPVAVVVAMAEEALPLAYFLTADRGLPRISAVAERGIRTGMIAGLVPRIIVIRRREPASDPGVYQTQPSKD